MYPFPSERIFRPSVQHSEPLNCLILVCYGRNNQIATDQYTPSGHALAEMKALAQYARNRSVMLIGEGYETGFGSNRWTKRRYGVHDGKVTLLPMEDSNLSLFSVENLEHLLLGSIKKYPAKHVIVILESHGNGLAYYAEKLNQQGELTSEYENLELWDLQLILEKMAAHRKKPVDLWVSAACSSGAELASIPGVNYRIATPNWIWSGRGSLTATTHALLKRLLFDSHSKMEAEDYAKLCTQLGNRLDRENNFLAYQPQQFRDFFTQLDCLGEFLSDGLDDPSTRAIILEAIASSFADGEDHSQISENDVRDARSFFTNLYNVGILSWEQTNSLITSAAKPIINFKDERPVFGCGLILPALPSATEINRGLVRPYSDTIEWIRNRYAYFTGVPHGWKEFVLKLLDIYLTEEFPKIQFP